MNAWVSIIALVAWLVLALSALRAHRIGAKQTVVMALAWILLADTAPFSIRTWPLDSAAKGLDTWIVAVDGAPVRTTRAWRIA